MDTVQATEPTATLGGAGAITAIGASLEEVHRANTRANAAERRVGVLEDREATQDRRIAALEAEKKVDALKIRQARRDGWWALLCGALALLVVGLCATLLFVLTGGPLG